MGPRTLRFARMEIWQIPFRHNAWATGTLLEACRPLSAEQFHRRFEIGCGTLHDTFAHVIGAMSSWADRITDAPLRPRPAGATTRSIDELLAWLESAARELEAAAAGVVREQREFEMMEFRNAAGELLARFRRGTALAYITAHGMHHRAQALNMLRHVGVTPLPEVDVIDWEYSSGEWPADA